jgi:hypothetical protein
MEASLKLKDGFNGNLKSLAGSTLKLTVTGPDNPTNRAFFQEVLFQLESGRSGFSNGNPDSNRDFPGVTFSRVGNRFLITERTYGGMPFFESFGGTRDDLRYTMRAVDCLNRFSGLSNRQISEMPHVTDTATAFDILRGTVEELLAGKATTEDLAAALSEALIFFSGTPPKPRPLFTLPILRNLPEPPDETPEEDSGSGGSGGSGPKSPVKPPPDRILSTLR